MSALEPEFYATPDGFPETTMVFKNRLVGETTQVRKRVIPLFSIFTPHPGLFDEIPDVPAGGAWNGERVLAPLDPDVRPYGVGEDGTTVVAIDMFTRTYFGPLAELREYTDPSDPRAKRWHGMIVSIPPVGEWSGRDVRRAAEMYMRELDVSRRRVQADVDAIVAKWEAAHKTTVLDAVLRVKGKSGGI